MNENESIFSLAFVVVVTESTETWDIFSNHLKEHVLKQCTYMCLLSYRHHGMLVNMFELPEMESLICRISLLLKAFEDKLLEGF